MVDPSRSVRLDPLGHHHNTPENGLPTIVFSRTRAPGVAKTFDDAVGGGAPTTLSQVSQRQRDINRTNALRGRSPVRLSLSREENPIACSAQGGCGALARAVPKAQQDYQGGVLSAFFRQNGIRPGDSFNVAFGP